MSRPSGRLTSGAARAFAADRPVAQPGVLAWMVEAGEMELAFWVVAEPFSGSARAGCSDCH